MKNLTQAVVRQLAVPGDGERWYPDHKTNNLWLRVWPTGAAKWVLRYRADGIQRKLTLGDASAIGLDDARKLAAKRQVEIADGADPVVARNATRQAPTLEQLCQLHLQTKQTKCKASTLRNYDILWRRHILVHWSPRQRVASIGHAHVQALHTAMGAGANANRALEVLKVAFDLAIRAGWIVKNPTVYVEASTENVRQWVLSPAEIRRLLDACSTWTAEQRRPLALPYLVRLLLLSGRRVSEWTRRTWSEIPDSNRWRLADTKTGQRDQFITSDMRQVLNELRALELSPTWVIPSTDPDTPLTWPHEHWAQLRQLAGLDGLRLHDLRHTAGSYAAQVGGLSLREVADVLGHRSIQSSARYVGQWDEAGLAAAERASAALLGALDG